MTTSGDYFIRLNERTNTRFWINNPTLDAVNLAIKFGAVNCTTNPAYCSKLILSEKEYIHSLIDEDIFKIKDYDELADRVYRHSAKRILDCFLPIYNKSNGKQGYVTLQDDPRHDEDFDHIKMSIKENKKLGKNYMAKIPAIKVGIEVIEFCVSENIPICATEVFSIAQAIAICNAYQNACKKFGNNPPIYITHISGIFDEYLGKVAKRKGIKIDEKIIKQAGVSIARKEYKLLQKYGYTLLGGGARGTHHFLQLVGGNAHITINWSTAEEIINSKKDIVNCIEHETPKEVIDELRAKFIDFDKGYEDKGLSISEFSKYGPVQLFRNGFLKGWYILLAEIAARKNFLAI